MEGPADRDWIKQEIAIPAWVAEKARRALAPRVESASLPVLPARRLTPLMGEGDADSDAILPGVYYLKEGDQSPLHLLSHHATLLPTVHTWPFIFTATESASRIFTPTAINRAWTIIALELVDYSNGLPALSIGRNGQRTMFTLDAGDALHFRGDVAQEYCNLGGGLCTMIEWRYE